MVADLLVLLLQEVTSFGFALGVAASTFPKKLLMPNLVTILWEKVPGDSSWVSGTKVSSSRRWSSSAEVWLVM